MKTPPRPSRLICRAVRHWSAPTSAHVQTCADCQEFFARAQSLENSLRRDAARWPSEADAGLEQRILHAVGRAQRQGVRGAGTSSPWQNFLIAGGALAAAALVAVVFFRSTPLEPERVTRADAEMMIATVQSLSTRLDEVVETAIPSAGALVADNPLQRELDSLQTDARSALRFLALNFLPVAPEPAAQPRSG